MHDGIKPRRSIKQISTASGKPQVSVHEPKKPTSKESKLDPTKLYHTQHPTWEPLPVHPKTPEELKRIRRSRLYVVILILALGGIAWAGITVSRVEGILTPESKSVAVQGSFPVSLRGEPGMLHGETVVYAKKVERILPATGTEYVELKSRGTVRVFNNSAVPLTLTIGTRLETPDGLVYLTKKAVTIPIKKGSTPGSRDVEIEASEPGPRYNRGLEDFVVLGFKGTERAKTTTVRSITPLTGGQLDTVSVVPQESIDGALTELRNEFAGMPADDESLGVQIPEKFFLLSGARFVGSAIETIDRTDPTRVLVRIEAPITYLLLEKSSLAEKLGTQFLPTTSTVESTLSLGDIVSLRGQLMSGESSDNFLLPLEGQVTLLLEPDVQKVIESLQNKPRSELLQGVTGLTHVQKLELRVFPSVLWKLPASKNRFNITIAGQES